MSELSTIHTPSFLSASVKENAMILAKENRELTALSGKSGFGNAKNDFEVDVQASDVLDGSSLQLRGTLTMKGAAGGTCHLAGLGAYSLIPQITIEYNGQPVLNLTQDADYCAYLNGVLHDDKTVADIKNLNSLTGVQLKAGVAQSFVLDLSQYGSALNYFMVTGSVARMKIRIRFQDQLQRCFYSVAGEGGDTTDKLFTGYELNDLRVCGDFLTFHADAYNAMVRQLQSPKGVKMPTHSFVPSRNTLIPGTTNHRIQGSYQYRNLVSMYQLPVFTSIEKSAATGISAEGDRISFLQFVGHENFPTNYRLRLAGMNFVNENGSSGCSNKMEFFQGVYKAALRTPMEKSIGYRLAEGYANDNATMIIGASFVRGNDNLVEVFNSGTNAYVARGILETEFDTAVAQPNITLLSIGVVTTVLEVMNGQASISK